MREQYATALNGMSGPDDSWGLMRAKLGIYSSTDHLSGVFLWE